MPRNHPMSWEGPPKNRWVKMFKGVRYRVTCEELGAMVYTKEGSAKLAKQWWEKKLAELTGPSPVAQVIQAVEEIPIEKLRDMMLRGEAVRKILAELAFVKTEITREEVEAVVGEKVNNDAQALGKISDVVSKIADVERNGTEQDHTFKHHAERFLAIVRGEGSAMSYREIFDFVTSLYDAPQAGMWGEMNIAALDEERVEEVFLWLKASSLSAPTKKKRWGFFKRLVRFCWEARAIDLPRNLDSRALKFKSQAKIIATWDMEKIREVLKELKPQLHLYALLGLNCGMTNVDIGHLRKDQVDQEKGRLVRKRVKTAAHDQVPTVNYPLWPETRTLLEKCWSTHPELVLTSSDGTALYSSRFEGKETRKKDLLALAWKRAKVAIPLKAFRSISATLLESHEFYGRYKSHFLGHSPKSVVDKHYAAPSEELFDKIVLWLRGQVLAS